MKVKIGNVIYDSSEQPIMLQVNEFEREHISKLTEGQRKYCSYPPTGYSPEYIDEFMEVGKGRI